MRVPNNKQSECITGKRFSVGTLAFSYSGNLWSTHARTRGPSQVVHPSGGGAQVLTRAYRFSLNSSRVATGEPLLEIADVSLRFGGIHALSDISFTVSQGHVHAVIGPNGAGKSSLLNCTSGL